MKYGLGRDTQIAPWWRIFRWTRATRDLEADGRRDAEGEGKWG